MAYATLSEIKQWLGVLNDDNDDILSALLDAATAAVDQVANRSFDRKSVTEYYYGNGSAYIFLRRTPIVGVSAVSISGMPVTVTNDSIAIRRDGTFGTGDYVQITYTGGYSPIPADVKMAYKITVQAMWNSQAMDPNLTSESVTGVFSGGFDAFGPGAVPRAAQTLLRGYISRYWNS